MIWKVAILAILHGVFWLSLSSGQSCNTLGFICTSCNSLQFCTNGIPTSVELTCATNTYCDSTSSSYCSSTVCTDDPATYYNCTAAGRFAITDNCTAYIFCGNNTNGQLIPTTFVCPNTTVFNPASSLCVLSSAYNCTDSNTVNTTTSTTTTPCTALGRFANTTDSTCQSYYYCYQLNTNGTAYEVQYLTCPTTTVFNEITQKCVAPTAYTCPY